mgnify:CR=1 FL=1
MSSPKDRVEALLKRAEELVNEARKTDYMMPTILPFVPAILIFIGVLMLFIGVIAAITPRGPSGLGLIAAGLVVIIVAIVLNFYVVYRWIKRRNDHFSRTLMFFEVVSEIAELLNFRKTPLIKSRLNELREVNSRERSAIANTILIIVPLYIYYVYHFLNKDFSKHSEKEKLLLAELVDEVRERVPTFIRRAEELKSVPERSTFLYLILTIFTGLFLLYWVYTLTKDPNNHFESHGILEREILAALREIASKA